MTAPDPFRDEVEALPGQFRGPAPAAATLSGRGRLVFAGMGGSGLAAAFAAAWIARDREVHVHRDPGLPAWAGADDAVVCVSASGATRETLSAWEEAGRRGCPRAAVSAEEGPLAARARDAGAPWAGVPKGPAPRSLLGHLVRGCFAVAGADGPDAGAVADHLETVRRRALEETASGPAAWAGDLAGRLPAVASGDALTRLAARRWAADLTENAEVPTLVWDFPEAAHNHVMALAREAPRPFPVAVIAVGVPRDAEAAALFGAAVAVLRGAGAPVTAVRDDHDDPWISALGLAYLGDWTSVFLAERSGTPAASLSLLLELKERLARDPG